MFGSLPSAARALLGVRVLNQLGAFALSFMAVLAGPHLVTATLAVFGAATLVSRWAGGVLLDRFAPRAVIAAGLGGTGAALIALALARTPAGVLAAAAAVGLAYEIYEPATTELLARVTTGSVRRHAYALFGTSLVAAGAVAGLLATVLLPLGVRWLLAADAATCLAAAATTVAFLPRDRPQRRAASRARWRPPARLARLTLAATAFAFGHLGVMMYLPFVLLQRGAPAWVPGLVMTASAVLAPAAAHLTRAPLAGRPHAVPLAVGAVVLGGLSLAMAGTSGVPLTAALAIVWAAPGGILIGRWPAIVAEIAPEDERPRWFAFLGLSWGIAQPVVPGLVGLLTGLAGGTGTTALLVAAVAFLAVPLGLARGTVRFPAVPPVRAGGEHGGP